jgi:hypothetical protein
VTVLDDAVAGLLRRLADLERTTERLAAAGAPGRATTWLGGGSGGASAIDFTNISQSYRHLMIVLSSQNATAATNVLCQLSTTGTTWDTSNSYDWQYGLANAATPLSGEGFGQQSIFIGSHSAAANVMSSLVLWFPDYRQTTHHKACLSDYGRKDGTTSGTLFRGQIAGFWRNTAAIKGVRLVAAANNFSAGSRADLYALP